MRICVRAESGPEWMDGWLDRSEQQGTRALRGRNMQEYRNVLLLSPSRESVSFGLIVTLHAKHLCSSVLLCFALGTSMSAINDDPTSCGANKMRARNRKAKI